jgi:hypothetical protein
MKHKNQYTFIIYAPPEKRRFSGILGEIDLYKVYLLLAGGKYVIEESYSGKDPIEWYCNILKEQEIYIRDSKIQKNKGNTYVWLQVDTGKTQIEEFTFWDELSSEDTNTLAWRTYLYPCEADRTKECLGLGVIAQETRLTEKKESPLYLNEVLDAIFS